MAGKRTRRRFTAEFKAQAAKRLLEDGKPLSEVATELGLSPGQLSAWRNDHLAAGPAETQRLKRESKRLRGGGGRERWVSDRGTVWRLK